MARNTKSLQPWRNELMVSVSHRKMTRNFSQDDYRITLTQMQLLMSMAIMDRQTCAVKKMNTSSPHALFSASDSTGRPSWNPALSPEALSLVFKRFDAEDFALDLLPCETCYWRGIVCWTKIKDISKYSFLHTLMSVPIHLDLECCWLEFFVDLIFYAKTCAQSWGHQTFCP